MSTLMLIQKQSYYITFSQTIVNKMQVLGMWCCINVWVIPDISNVHIALIFKAETV